MARCDTGGSSSDLGEGPTNGLGDGGERLHEWIFQGSGDHPKEAVGGGEASTARSLTSSCPRVP